MVTAIAPGVRCVVSVSSWFKFMRRSALPPAPWPGAACHLHYRVRKEITLMGFGDNVHQATNGLKRGVDDDTVKSIGRGNVPAGIYATRANAATADVMIKGPEIFGGMANLVRGAKHEVAMQTYEYESGSDAAKTITSAFKDLEQSR